MNFLDYFSSVKNKFKILSIVVLTAIYCLAIAPVNLAFSHSNYGDKLDFSQEKTLSDLSVKLFYPSSQSESSVSDINNLSGLNLNSSFVAIGVFNRSTEGLMQSLFSQYIRFWENLLLRHKKSNLIFPFHYFW